MSSSILTSPYISQVFQFSPIFPWILRHFWSFWSICCALEPPKATASNAQLPALFAAAKFAALRAALRC